MFNDNPKTRDEWEKLWRHFNRMQRRVMSRSSITTHADFFAEPEQDRLDFYHWMETQCGEYSCYV